MSFAGFTPAHVTDLLVEQFSGTSLPTPADVEAAVRDFLVGPFASLRASSNEIVENVLKRVHVKVGAASILKEDKDHVDWLPSQDRASWRLSSRLADYLKREDGIPPAVLSELDRSTDESLKNLESPLRGGRWDRRGMVVGLVQSGKTTHYTTLASKALDAGYQLVIILAGIHNNLRSQTHERIDKYLIGFDSAQFVQAQRDGNHHREPIGVGDRDRRLGRAGPEFSIVTCTTSADEGDFSAKVANRVGGLTLNSGLRMVMVVKKNVTVLRGLIRWLRSQNLPDAQEARRIDAPTLVIDDEADHASINTAQDPEADPTRVNQLIRQLLISFNRVGFVGYTATPFANIFIQPDGEHPEFGPDLFPSSFIVNLKPPSDYVGPDVVFGHPGDEAANIPPKPPLPMHVPVNDFGGWLPDRHKKTISPGHLPDSLNEAIRLFFLVCSARRVRGKVNVHNSMLVHATRFTYVQDRVTEQVRGVVSGLHNILDSGSAERVAKLEADFHSIWKRRIADIHGAFSERLLEMCPPLPAWGDVWPHVRESVRRTQVMAIHGDSEDTLAYSREKKGLYVIAIGGDKLSRGLTLEGLSVSYFLRTSKMFDTLLQMGRWFGYRPGYIDLCRVYTPFGLYSSFREVALALDDLRKDLDRMAKADGRRPIDFGLRVRTPSDGLLITAANKLRTGQDVQVRFAGEVVQALKIPRLGKLAADNVEAVETLLRGLPPPPSTVRGEEAPHRLWTDVPADRVLKFLEDYRAEETASFLGECENLRNYIIQQGRLGELTQWTVAVVSKRSGEKIVTVAGQQLFQVHRGHFPKEDRTSDYLDMQGVVGSEDETLDLSEDEYRTVDEKYAADAQEVAGKRQLIRETRPPGRGLLLIYPIDPQLEDGITDKPEYVPAVAISFPASKKARPLEYRVNDVWLRRHGLSGDWDDDGQAI